MTTKISSTFSADLSNIIGVLGGGQLGMMMIEAGNEMGLAIHCLDPNPMSPCASLAASFTLGDFTDFDAVYSFGKDKTILTIEIENVNIEALVLLEKEGVLVYPQAAVLSIIKDKGLQKEFYQRASIPTAEFKFVTGETLLSTIELADYPFVQKLRTGGYDGKGVQIINGPDDLISAFLAPSIIEKKVDFEKEISILVARNLKGEVVVFPAVECEFSPKANLVEFQFSPANISNEIALQAAEMAKKIINRLEMIGLLAVEFFLTRDGELLVNEIAPRPHNSGHHTIECCTTSQFTQHLRAILNLPLGDTSLKLPAAMLNILGEPGHSGPVYYEGLEAVLELPDVFVHLYGKTHTLPFRKMGHVTVLGSDLSEIKQKIDRVKKLLKCISR